MFNCISKDKTIKILSSNLTSAEGWSTAAPFSSFDSDGFSVQPRSPYNANNLINKNGEDFVAWCWKAGGAAVTNTDGTITSQVSANTEAGFSIVSYTGNVTQGATFGHGLNSAPKMVIIKSRTTALPFTIYNSNIGATKYLYLPSTNGAGIYDFWNNTDPTDTVVNLSSDVNVNGTLPMIAYCFAEVAGFSKFGSYVGNGSVSGPTITTDFEPAFVLIKPSGSPSAIALPFPMNGNRPTFNS